jgi:hypothetical protein
MTMTKKFNNCKNNFYRISEMIHLHSNGSSKYTKEYLDEQLDQIHEELCDLAWELAEELIWRRENHQRVDRRAKERLEDLYFWAVECRDYGYYPESYELNDYYGNGVIGSVGADFGSYGYKEFRELLDEYNLLLEY